MHPAAPTSRSAFTSAAIVLLQPTVDFEERLPSADALSSYIKALHTTSYEFWKNHQVHNPASGEVIVALRPKSRRRVWSTLPDTTASSATLSNYLASLQNLPVPSVTTGTAIFALQVGLGCEFKLDPLKLLITTAPLEWARASDETTEPINIDQLVDKVWPWE